MIRTKDMKKAKYDSAIHISLKDAAKSLGYVPTYFSLKIAPGYGLTKYIDGQYVYFLKTDIDRIAKAMKKNVLSNGHHKRGKLPRGSKRHRAVRRDAGIPRSPELTIVVTPENIRKMIQSGMKVNLVMNNQ